MRKNHESSVTTEISNHSITTNDNNNTQSPKVDIKTGKPTRTRRPDRQVYVPRARRSQTTPPSTTLNQSLNNKNQPTSHLLSPTEIVQNEHLPQITSFSSVIPPPGTKRRSNDENIIERDNHLQVALQNHHLSSKIEPNCIKNHKTRDSSLLIKQNTIDNSECDPLVNNISNNSTITLDNMPPTKKHHKGVKIQNSTLITTNGITKEFPKKDDDINQEEKELRKASQEINRTSRRIIKQTFNSDVLEIGDINSQDLCTKEIKKIENHKEQNNKVEKVKSDDINPEEDDWENMFDETGDCLNPKMMDELTAQVGKVTIEKPKTDYKVRV